MGELLRLHNERSDEPAPVLEATPALTCFTCTNGTWNDSGTYCLIFNEWIADEHVAARCEAYENPERDATVTEIEDAKWQPRSELTPLEIDVDIPDDLVQACDDFLAACRISSWGRSFDVLSEDGRHLAAAWLANQMVRVGLTR